MPPILTITLNPTIDASGETDAVRPTRKTRLTGLRHDPGGGGINVARVIAVLGGEAEALYLAGGEMGDFLERLMREQGVHCHRVPISGQTRVAYMVREICTGLEYRFIPEGPDVSAQELKPCFDAIAARHHGYVVASGSLPPGVPDDTYATMAAMAAKQGLRFVLDGSGAGLHRALDGGGLFLVKPSWGELESYAGRRLDEDGLRHVAMDLVARKHAAAVAVTLGQDGALLATAEGIIREPAIHVRVRSAVGSGDSFLAAMVWALSEDHPIEKAFRLGMAAGAAAAMTPGTELCRRDDVLTLHGAPL
jgi:6-phosphofructokinase 2